MSSAESLTSSSPTPASPPQSTSPLAELPLAETPEQAVQNAISWRAGLSRLLGMVGIKSIKRNLETEDAAVKRQMDADHDDIYGGAGGPTTSPPEGEAMGEEYMVAGNMTVIHQHPAPPAASPPTAAAVVKQGLPTAVKALVAGSLLTGAGGAGYILKDLLTPPPASANYVDTDTITELDFPKPAP